MRKAYKLLLLCAMALTALALTAGPAAAQESAIQVEDEELGGHCNPCVVHAVSEEDSVIITHVFGHEEEASRCRDEFIAEVFEDGTGHIDHQVLTGAACTQQACDSAGESQWPISSPGETGPGTGHMDVEFCLEDAGGGTERHCDAEVQIEEEATDPHHLFFSVDEHCPITFGVESEVTGHWETEAEHGMDEEGRQETDIEIHHL